MTRQPLSVFSRAARPGALMLLALVLVACAEEQTPEQQIIDTIKEMEGFAERAESRRFTERLDPAFTAQGGQMNRDQVRALVLLQLKRYQDIEVRIFPVDVQLRDDGQADAVFPALLTGGPGWIPESGQVYEFQTRWRLNEDDDWVLLEASWKPIPLSDVL